MSLSIGIVGLPNVGKSSLFTALTKKGGLAANYPFATIDQNVGIVAVPDARLDALAAIDHPAKIVPATVEFVDIAGLVAGASQGEGLGNKFLANIRETDAICEVVRFFSDPNVEHVAHKVDPRSDVVTASGLRFTKTPADIPVVDTVGAGDSFMGGIIDAMWGMGLRGGEARETLRTLPEEQVRAIIDRASAVSDVTVSRKGANPPWAHELA